MSWVGWLFLLAGLYVVVLLVRAGIDFALWFFDEYFSDRKARRRQKEKAAAALHPPKPKATGPRRETATVRSRPTKSANRPPGPSTSRAGKPSRLSVLRKRLELRFAKKTYDHWVAAALSEDDAELKLQYLSKAVRLDPTYLPAWGLKANALYDLQRFPEAIECFARSLAACPSPLGWYKKGVCCHRLGRRAEALECFQKAIDACRDGDCQLLDDATRLKHVVEEELHRPHASEPGVQGSGSKVQDG